MNSFNFIALAVDAGNNSATVTVQVYVTGEDEYDPFSPLQTCPLRYQREPRKVKALGKYRPKMRMVGRWDCTLLFPNSSPYFDVNKTTGVIYLKMTAQAAQVEGVARRGKLA